MILESYYIEDLESKESPLWWQKQGLSYTSTGYGRKIPSTKMIKLPDSNRWRRVYCCIHSNSGVCYVLQGKDWIVVR